MMERTVKTVTEGIVKKIARIDLNAGRKVKAKGVNVFAALTECGCKQRHECMKSKGIRKQGFIAAMEIAARDSRGIERETHVGKAGADELSVDSRVMREGRAKESLIIIELVRKNMLELEALDCCSKCPK